MSMAHRLQILLDEDRYRRLSDVAQREGRSVAAVVREALDRTLGESVSERETALQRILGAEPMPAPDPDQLRGELEELRGRRG